MATISDNLQVVTARIARAARAAGRDPFSVTLLAVSKSQPVARIEEARAAGHQAFGENYVQEALEKMDALPGLEWHLIGPLQSNKTRMAAERFAWVHTLEREKIARRLSEQRPSGAGPSSSKVLRIVGRICRRTLCWRRSGRRFFFGGGGLVFCGSGIRRVHVGVVLAGLLLERNDVCEIH